MRLRTYLIITGIGALIALTMPTVVVVLSFLIIPGLILGMMPTAFMYGVAFAVFGRLLGIYLSGISRHLLSGAATLALFWAIPQPGLTAARNQLATLKVSDVKSTGPIALTGNILVTRPSKRGCDELCAALLKTPGVTSVRIADRVRASSYRIVLNTVQGDSATPTGYGLLDEEEYIGRDDRAARLALQAEWNLMLSEGNALVVSDEKPAPDFTITIEDGPAVSGGMRPLRMLDWSLGPSTPHRKAFTISNAKGQILLRQSILSISAPFAPLLIGARGGIENFRFRWERTRLGDGKVWDEAPIDRLLLDHTNIARGVDIKGAKTKMRGKLARAIDDPLRSLGDPAFALANQWMESFASKDQPFSDSDRRLLARVFEDTRVESAKGSWAIIERVDDEAADLRRFAARRYLAARDKKKESAWINSLAKLPEGSYSVPLPEEQAILADPALSHYAVGLIKRQGDRGADAVPDLLRLLREYSAYDPGRHGFSNLTSAIEAVRSGFRRIGPAASVVRPEIEDLLRTPALNRRYGIGKEDWDLLLVVLGRPADTLMKPENRTGTDADYRQRLVKRAAKPYDARRD